MAPTTSTSAIDIDGDYVGGDSQQKGSCIDHGAYLTRTDAGETYYDSRYYHSLATPIFHNRYTTLLNPSSSTAWSSPRYSQLSCYRSENPRLWDHRRFRTYRGRYKPFHLLASSVFYNFKFVNAYYLQKDVLLTINFVIHPLSIISSSSLFSFLQFQVCQCIILTKRCISYHRLES